MSAKLSRDAQWMISNVFKDRGPVFDKYGVTISGVTFLLNDRAIGRLNEQAFEMRGQFPGLMERTPPSPLAPSTKEKP